MCYIELWFDAEEDQCWKITIWYIDKVDFEPFTTDYQTLPMKIANVHNGAEVQARIAKELRAIGYHKVYTNNFNPRSKFQVRPAWYEELLRSEDNGDPEAT